MFKGRVEFTESGVGSKAQDQRFDNSCIPAASRLKAQSLCGHVEEAQRSRGMND